MRWISRACIGLSLAVLAPASGATAATLNVVGGQLVGASGVDVGGTLYDVAFVDGTCIELYSGCDDPSDFTFTTSADALAASQALLDQVFLDGPLGNFDTEPDLTAGCGASSFPCSSVGTPWQSDGFNVFSGVARNYADEGSDVALGDGFGFANYDCSSDGNCVFATWSPVSEPTTAVPIGPVAPLATGAALLGLGVAGLALRRAR